MHNPSRRKPIRKFVEDLGISVVLDRRVSTSFNIRNFRHTPIGYLSGMPPCVKLTKHLLDHFSDTNSNRLELRCN